ncbi:MAG: biotin--[acetyl-CoA-carboxylase] ligase [Coriobacteriia bacterium]|nr:biotin--[acetyl-CoA-carboxylase] ligase [Coriobacteriia bacterium]
MSSIPEILTPIAPIYSWIAHYFLPWGLLVLLVLTIAETIPFVGLVTPGEVIIAAAAFVAVGQHVSLLWVFVLALAGSLIGSTAMYLTGRRLGIEGLRRFLVRYNGLRLPRFMRVDPGIVDDLKEYFELHGTVTILSARFIYGMKAFVPPVAGALRMSYARFLLNLFLGSSFYTLVLTLVGWFLMRNAALASDLFSGLGIFGVVLLIALAVFAALMVKQIAERRRRLMALRERARLTKITSVHRLASTNDYLKELIASGQSQGTALGQRSGQSQAEPGDTLLVIARTQTGGRGQFQRSWTSPAGGLYASLLYWPQRPVSEQSELSLLSAQVLCEVLTAQGVEGLFVKAPNDLYAPDGKLAGILLEASGQDGWLIIGVGVNVRRPRHQRQGFEGAAYLSDALKNPTPEDVAEWLFPPLLERIRSWDDR